MVFQAVSGWYAFKDLTSFAENISAPSTLLYVYQNHCGIDYLGPNHSIHPLSPQGHANLPYIIGADDGEHEDDKRHSQQRRVPLLYGIGSPSHQPRLSPLLGEELRPVRAHLCRSPVQDGRGYSPSSRPFTNAELSPSPSARLNGDPGSTNRPAKLLMPSLPCVSPLNLSPR